MNHTSSKVTKEKKRKQKNDSNNIDGMVQHTNIDINLYRCRCRVDSD